MTPDKQLDALVVMFPDLVWRNKENGCLFRKDTCRVWAPLNSREDIMKLIKFPGFFPHRKKFIQELVHVMDRDFGGEPSIDASDTMQPADVTAWLMLDATTPQVLEAVLRAGGKWQEDSDSAEADPYAELKAAHAAGKVIQAKAYGEWHDEDFTSCKMEDFSTHFLRIKPEPPFQLPPPPPGMQWHRTDGWTADMLPQGYRPLCVDEPNDCRTDEYCCGTGDGWDVQSPRSAKPQDSMGFWRTTRPLVFTHEGKTWTYHRPGDPIPCDGESLVDCLCDNLGIPDDTKAKIWTWEGNIIGWRYADEPKPPVPLGPEDVLPGSVFRCLEWQKHGGYFTPSVHKSGVSWTSGEGTLFETYAALLAGDWQINRSLPLTGKWNPTAWEPCHKPARARTPTLKPPAATWNRVSGAGGCSGAKATA